MLFFERNKHHSTLTVGYLVYYNITNKIIYHYSSIFYMCGYKYNIREKLQQ